MSRPLSVPVRSEDARNYGNDVVVGTSVVTFLVVAANAVIGGEGIKYSAAIAAVITFALLPVLMPAVRIDTQQIVSPRNWAVFAFGIALLAMPLLFQIYGPVQSVLPVAPAPDSINTAFLITSASYVAFGMGLSLGLRPQVNGGTDLKVGRVATTFATHPIVIILFVGLGIVGLVLRFGTVANVVDYFRFGSGVLTRAVMADLAGSATAGQAASSFLLPCLGMGFAMLWCRLIEVRRSRHQWTILLLVALGASSILVLFSFSLFSYNRGAIVVPIVAMAAAFSRHVRRIPMTLLVPSAAGLLVALLWLGSVRATYYTSMANPYAIAQTGLASVDLNKEIQIYGSGPQFLGYMIEISQVDGRMYMGGTLVPSIVDPFPIIGRAFRPFSGPVLYNYAVYGFYGVTDQLIPFDGELYWNFRLPGVLAGFLLIGIAIAALQRRFDASASPWAAFVVMYAAVWTTFLVVGSLSAVSQIALYFAWPMIFLAIADRVLRSTPRGSLAQSRNA